jgi:CHAT domain-containing protein
MTYCEPTSCSTSTCGQGPGPFLPIRRAFGRLRAGEMMIDMCRALLLAGACGLVASLWSVADVPIEDLMEAF